MYGMRNPLLLTPVVCLLFLWIHSYNSEYKTSTASAFCLFAGSNRQSVQKLNWSAEIFLGIINFLRFILHCIIFPLSSFVHSKKNA